MVATDRVLQNQRSGNGASLTHVCMLSIMTLIESLKLSMVTPSWYTDDNSSSTS